jgi:hypothetical protein
MQNLILHLLFLFLQAIFLVILFGFLLPLLYVLLVVPVSPDEEKPVVGLKDDDVGLIEEEEEEVELRVGLKDPDVDVDVELRVGLREVDVDVDVEFRVGLEEVELVVFIDDTYSIVTPTKYGIRMLEFVYL